MRTFGFAFVGFVSLLAVAALPAGGLHAATIPVGGPNPNWTQMQKFEWYLGRMAKAAEMCGAYTEAGVLTRLSRMTPYGDIGRAQMRGDGFYGAACAGITQDAKGLVADADKIQAYLESTYACQGAGCFDQQLVDWKSHECADELLGHLAERSVKAQDVSKMSFNDVSYYDISKVDYKVRVWLRNCQGSLYVELKKSCRIIKEYTRGDCQVAGVDRF